jgi:hypothetical protein
VTRSLNQARHARQGPALVPPGTVPDVACCGIFTSRSQRKQIIDADSWIMNATYRVHESAGALHSMLHGTARAQITSAVADARLDKLRARDPAGYLGSEVLIISSGFGASLRLKITRGQPGATLKLI